MRRYLMVGDNSKIKKAIRQYLKARSDLKRIGIWRSGRDLVSDYGEWLAAKVLCLKLNDSGVERGHDAISKDGKKYEIKTRTAMAMRPSFHFRRLHPKEFDYAVFIELEKDFAVKNFLIIPHAIVKKYAVRTERSIRFGLNNKVFGEKDIKIINLQ